MKLPWARLVMIVVALLTLLYVGDHFSVEYRIPNGREQFGSVEVQQVLAVPQKDHKTEFIANPPEEQQCVHSMFPQLGLTPCWYLARHANQQVNY